MPRPFPDFPQIFPLSPKTLVTVGKLVAGLGGLSAPELCLIPGLVDAIRDGSLSKALPILVSKGHLPEDVLKASFDLTRLVGASGLLKKFLDWSEQPTLAAAFNLLNHDRCDATSLGNPTIGELKPPKNGRFPVVFQVKEINGKMPVPTIKGGFNEAVTFDPNVKFTDDQIRAIVVNALNFWAGHLNIDLVGTDVESEANLLISGRQGGFGPDVVAIGDIGPLSRKRCRLIFNLDCTLSQLEFMYTVAHEFGHCLGVSHADVPRKGALMSPFIDLGASGLAITPRAADFSAAAAKNPDWKWDGIVD